MRTITGSKQEFKWDEKKLYVDFDTHTSGRHQGSSRHQTSDTPSDLRDLVHGKYRGGEVDDQLKERGYRHRNDTSSGDDLWSNWKGKDGNCVTVHFDEDRKVQSIVDAPDADCHR